MAIKTSKVNINYDGMIDFINQDKAKKEGLFLRLSQPSTRIRTIPGWPGATVPYVSFFQHVLAATGFFEYVTCLNRDRRRPGVCPICDFAAKLANSDHEAEKEEAKQFFARPARLFNVLVRGQKSNDDMSVNPVKPFLMPVSVFEIWQQASMNRDEYPGFLDIMRGRDLIITRAGTGKQIKYSAMVAGKPTMLGQTEEETIEIYNGAHDLTELTIPKPKKEVSDLLHAFLGENEEKDQDEDEGGAAPPSQSKASKKQEEEPVAAAEEGGEPADDDEEDDDTPTFASEASPAPAEEKKATKPAVKVSAASATHSERPSVADIQKRLQMQRGVKG